MGTKTSNPILIGVIAGLTALLDYIGVIGFPIGVFGVSAFYIGSAFFTAFALWFGLYGLLAIYVGLLIGAMLSGTFTVFALLLAWGNVIGAAIPMLVFRFGKFDPSLKRWSDYAVFVLSATLAQNIVSAIWVLTGFYLFGIMPADAIRAAVVGWILGGIIVSIVIGIPLLKTLTPIVRRTSLYKSRIW
jgi:hypothetical protein